MYCPDCEHELSVKPNGNFHCQGCGTSVNKGDELKEHPTKYFELGTWWNKLHKTNWRDY